MKKIGIIIFGIFNILLYILPILLVIEYKKFDIAPTPVVNKIKIDDHNKVTIKVGLKDKRIRNDIFYLYKTNNDLPKDNDSNWKLLENGEFSFDLDKKDYFVFLKNEDEEIFPVESANKLGKITSISLNKDNIYLAIKGTYQLNIKYEFVGYIDEKIIWSSDDEKIAKVDQNGKVKGIKKGNTKIHAKIHDKDVYANVIVTDLIVVRPKEYNRKKPYLKCNKYSEADNDLLDTILKDRINDVGYKTRAGAVEAARFLALEFPYKIRYFSENGRGSTNGVDGEGRYYHVGLYLNKSRFKSIKKRSAGPQTWGCSLYSRPSHGKRPNGLDCSGFVSWVMLNGGFNVGDIGAGLAPHLDLTDYGKRIRFNADVVKSGVVKVGDLLSSGGLNGGHIAIIAGEDDKYYYVAESLWTPPNVAVVIIGYSKKTIFNRYFYVMLMDSYYKSDGKLTKLWY